jgi:hypothetical protein
MYPTTLQRFTAKTLLLIALILTVSLNATARTMHAGKSAGDSNSSAEPVAAGRSHDVKINIRIAGKTLSATLADNATARDFVALLPLSLSMGDLFGREKYGNLPRALSENGPRRRYYELGDIAYWSPSHDVAIYYRVGGEEIPTPGIIPIGKIDSGIEAFNVPDSVRVTIELAQ